MKLKEAIVMIQSLHLENEVVMIEFEDGSGYKFNYRLGGEQKNRFINLKERFAGNEFIQQYEAIANIMSKF